MLTSRRQVALVCCGDVMTGRGVDQILAHPGDPALREPLVKDARVYVGLAEEINGAIPRPVDPWWLWGDALAVIEATRPDLRLINLETSITISDDFAPGKAVHYRMHPANIGCLTVARPDICTLANNHILDFGVRGLRETLTTLASAGITAVGAGLNSWEAAHPATVRAANGTRMTVLGLAMLSSGVPQSWASTLDRPGINLQSTTAIARTVAGIREAKAASDIVVVSVHWGSNWGYEIPPDQIRLAHELVDAGADFIHGHSSHHPRPAEVYRGRLILYGCGDFITDYEGIGGHHEYREDLRLLYLPVFEATGEFAAMTIVVLQARQMRLDRAGARDLRWTQSTLDRISRPLGARIRHGQDGTLDCR
ncbi:CapA family protein [Catelliglobosispora koreensis]|uniref:CapA family protein n=1 Tax=Catelliglobosispora koreensis TaxID=129052 RepID=UPI0003A4B77E|nr:CapA family protein [Catelliglobosispora koreensis]